MRFNTAKVKEQIKNYEGEKAYKGDRYLQLYLNTATQMIMTDKFYGDKETQYQEWLSAVREMADRDPEYLLRLAAYVRNELKLRTAPIIMLTETVMIAHENNKPQNYELARKYSHKIIQRADELAEIIAYYISVTGKIGTDTPHANGLPRTLKTIINNIILSDKFSEYNLVKNDKNNASVSLRDVLRITHPYPKDKETAEFFRKVVKRESFADISEGETWEGIISREGSTTEAWSKALAKMPIFATVRNIRNVFDNDVPFELIQKHVINKLQNQDIIMKSRMLPFRFYQAYKEVKNRSFETDMALEKAITLATQNNVPKFDGITAVFVDLSGSMSNRLNDKSTMEYREISALFGAIMAKRNGAANTLLVGYDDNLFPIKINEIDSMFHTMNSLLSNGGGGTDAWKCIQMLIDHNFKVDRIMFFSDEQSYNTNDPADRILTSFGYRVFYSNSNQTGTVNELLKKYRQTINSDVILYDVDLSGYGTLQFDPNNPKTVQVGGWSERIFDLMNVMETGKKGNIRELVAKLYP